MDKWSERRGVVAEYRMSVVLKKKSKGEAIVSKNEEIRSTKRCVLELTLAQFTCSLDLGQRIFRRRCESCFIRAPKALLPQGVDMPSRPLRTEQLVRQCLCA